MGRMSDIKADVKKIVTAIPFGVTPAGWEVLEHNRDLAVSFIEIGIQECTDEILKAKNSGENAEYLPFMNDSLKEFNRIKKNLLNN